jgi:hypothetical protein
LLPRVKTFLLVIAKPLTIVNNILALQCGKLTFDALSLSCSPPSLRTEDIFEIPSLVFS